jgi:hypothetical protein
MKRILIPVSNSFFSRNFLRNGFATMLKREGWSVIFLAPSEKIAYYKKEFGCDALFGELPRNEPSTADYFFRKLEGWSIHSRFILLAHLYFLTRPNSKDSLIARLLIFPIRLLLWQLGRFRLWRAFIRSLFSFTPHHHIRALLKDYAPDVVFCPFINLGQEWHFLKEAKKLGIRTVGMTPSWDNFYSKTFLRVQPDALLVQTYFMREQAVCYGDYPLENIFVTGVPQYDRFFLGNGIVQRDEFLKSIGVDPKKKLIVFGCSGKISYESDVAMLPILRGILDRLGLSDSTQVLVRPHPKRVLAEYVLEKSRRELNFIAETHLSRLDVSRDPWEFDEHSISFLANTLAHADVVITICTTFFVEAAIFGKPLVAIGFDIGKEKIYWNSSRRFAEWEHLADIFRTDGIWRVKSESELSCAISAYLANPTLHIAGRKRIVREQAVFTDGKSLERVVKSLSDIYKLS